MIYTLCLQQKAEMCQCTRLTMKTNIATYSNAFECQVLRINCTPIISTSQIRSFRVCTSKVNLPTIPERKLTWVMINSQTIRSWNRIIFFQFHYKTFLISFTILSRYKFSWKLIKSIKRDSNQSNKESNG